MRGEVDLAHARPFNISRIASWSYNHNYHRAHDKIQQKKQICKIFRTYASVFDNFIGWVYNINNNTNKIGVNEGNYG